MENGIGQKIFDFFKKKNFVQVPFYFLVLTRVVDIFWFRTTP